MRRHRHRLVLRRGLSRPLRGWGCRVHRIVGAGFVEGIVGLGRERWTVGRGRMIEREGIAGLGRELVNAMVGIVGLGRVVDIAGRGREVEVSIGLVVVFRSRAEEEDIGHLVGGMERLAVRTVVEEDRRIGSAEEGSRLVRRRSSLDSTSCSCSVLWVEEVDCSSSCRCVVVVVGFVSVYG